MVPLKIVFKLLTPPAFGHPWIHFDALIAHLVARRELGSKYYTLSSKWINKKVIELSENLPLQKIGDPWFYASSVSLVEGAPSSFKIYKRFHTKNIPQKTRKRKVTTSRGYFRSFMMTVPYIPTDEIVFYANGEKEELEHLLSFVSGLGKKRAIGFGTVKKVIIVEESEDCSIEMKGVILRPIPIEAIKKINQIGRIFIATSPFRPPYWSKRNVAKCLMPFSQAQISLQK